MNDAPEEWVIRKRIRVRQIAFATSYYVGTNGTVWTRKRGKFRRMKQQTNPDGYKRVTFFLVGKKRSYYVHRLVLLAFVGPCPFGMEGCHGPGGQRDNSLANVRWDTPKANAADRIRARYARKYVPSSEPIPE